MVGAMVKRKVFEQIQKLKYQGYNISQVANEMALDRKTARKYLKMSDQEFSKYEQNRQFREKYLDSLKNDILAVFEKNDNRRLVSASVYDYLEEKLGELKISERSLRNYIQQLQQQGDLVLTGKSRIYQKVKEQRLGKQLQLDFGQYRFDNNFKVYIFAAVLAASRYKFVTLQDIPFTTNDVIRHLLSCFDYIGGMPEEIVIDQDRLMVVSENSGDIIYTRDFDYFKSEMGFEMYVCRKADPESKGKVENLVKFVKGNFFDAREFNNIDDANESLKGWLKRRANGKLSQATMKIPANEIIEERKHLKSIRNSIYRKDKIAGREKRTVNKKGCITVKSNDYQMPQNYCGRTLDIYTTEFKLFVFDPVDSKQIAEFDLSPLSGKTIVNRDLLRRKEEKIDKIKQEILEIFPDVELWGKFVRANFKTHSRYVRDQSIDCKRLFPEPDKLNKEALYNALEFCMENNTLYFANLSDSYKYFADNEKSRDSQSGNLSKSRISKSVDIQQRDLRDYNDIAKSGGLQ